MSDAIAPIQALIKEAKSSLSRLEEKAATLRTQIESYERALRAVEAASGQPRPTRAKELTHLLDAALGRRRRTLTVQWARILKHVGEFEDGIKSDKIHEFSESQALSLDRNNLRSQLHNYSVSKVLERVSPGVFRLTDYGRQLVSETLEVSQDDMLERTAALKG